MQVIITEWALQSYLDLKYRGVFTNQEYRNVIRPDVNLLKSQYPGSPKFKQSSFWGHATLQGGQRVADGYKMKWDSIGPGRVELRLGVALLHNRVFLCRAYIKDSPIRDKREAAKLQVHIQIIRNQMHIERGHL